MQKPKVRVDTVPNPQIRLFHTNFALCEESFGPVIEMELFDDDLEEIERQSESTQNLHAALVGIEGIVGYHFNKYYLSIEKAPLFEWSDIEPMITSLIMALGQKQTGEEVELLGASSSWRHPNEEPMPAEFEEESEMESEEELEVS